MTINTAGCFAPCANVLCAQYGCQRMQRSGYPGAGTYTVYSNPYPCGCICPPGANKECENQYCPRKPVPSVSSQLGAGNE